jgi:hypothetical protein
LEKEVEKMRAAKSRRAAKEPEAYALTQLSPEVEPEKPLAWELIDTGRYRPRRIRGSFLGGELG